MCLHFQLSTQDSERSQFTFVEPRGFLTSDDPLTMSQVLDMSPLSCEFQLRICQVPPTFSTGAWVRFSQRGTFLKGPCQLHLCRSKADTGLNAVVQF